MSGPQDGCPAWADALITKIRDLEASLGNIPMSADWTMHDVQGLYEKLSGLVSDEGDVDPSVTEVLFDKLALALAREGFTPSEIADFVNARIYYAGSPPYCSEEEVAESLTKAK